MTSRMFVVAIDDPAKAEAFLAALQEHKTVAFPGADGKFRKALVTFAYRTDATGKCHDHDTK